MRPRHGVFGITVSAVILAATAYSAAAQTPQTFSKVTIRKSANSQQQTPSYFSYNGRHLVIANMPLQSIVRFAYGVPAETPIQGAPAWVDSTRYDIDASMDQGGTVAADGTMDRTPIQILLAERFHLVVHIVPQDFRGAALVRTSAVLNQKSSANAGTNGASDSETQTRLNLNLALRDNPSAIRGRTLDEQCLRGQVLGGCYLDSPTPPVRTGLETAGLTLVPVLRRGNVIVIDHVKKLAK